MEYYCDYLWNLLLIRPLIDFYCYYLSDIILKEKSLSNLLYCVLSCLQAWRHAISFPFRSFFLLRGGDGHDHPALIFISTIYLIPLFILPDPSFGLGTPGPGGRDRSVFGQTRWQNLQEQRSPAVRVQPPSNIRLKNSNLRYLII